MSNTQGNFYSSSNENHAFVTNDPIMLQLGLQTFTLSGIKQALKQIADDYESDIGDEEFFSKISGGNADIYTLFTGSSTWTAQAFNKSSGKFTTVSKGTGDLVGLIEQYETKVEDLLLEHGNKQEFSDKTKAIKDWLNANVNYIKSNSERCFQRNGPIFYDESDVGQLNLWTKLYFHIPSFGIQHDARVVAQKGMPPLAAVARTATGLAYSKTKTDNARADQHAGLFIKPDDMTGSVQGDLAAGNIRLSFNDSLGMWESSQSILARLITELPPAGNQAFQMPKEGSDGFLEDEGDSELFYDKGSKYYSGKFTTGLAVPVSAQDGNPHLFGPNIIVDYNEKRIEKIRVVNRSEKTFTQGTLVLCTLIGAEWIVQEFSLAGEGLPAQFGTWTFSKLIANSDAFFRVKGDPNTLWNANTYETKAKQRWYYEWKNNVGTGGESILSFHNADEIMKDNDGTSDHGFNPHLGYFTATSFDSAQYYTVTSVETAMTNSQQNFVMGEDVPNYWGPIFPDGYQQRAVLVNEGSPQGINSEKYFPQSAFAGTERSNIPADMAINGIYSDEHNSSPILPLDYWQSLLNGGGTFLSNAKTYRENIYQQQTVYQERGLNPSNPNKVQFSPLFAELVIHADPKASQIDGPYEQRKSIKESMVSKYGAAHMFGKMFERYSSEKPSDGDYLPYDYYNKTRAITKPNGTLRIYSSVSSDPFPDNEGLNLVGITAGINRFSKPGGGALNIEIFEDIGPPKFTSVTSGQSASFNSVAAFFGVVAITPGSGPQQFGFPQWGSNTDNYNSFGTTALHCRIFDAWPRNDTIWDTRYFAALHFNPSQPEEDQEYTSVDFQVPTMVGGSFPSEGTAITSNTTILDQSDWTYDFIRRGKLLSGGGFNYKKLTIGLNPDSLEIIKPGEAVESDNFELPGNNVKMKINAQNGAVTGVEFTQLDDLGNVMSGEDFDKASFSERYYDDSDPNNIIDKVGYIIRFGDAVLSFQGTVRKVRKIDTGPQEHGGIKRLTTGTAGDSDRITGVKTTEFSLNPNNSGEYDAYFFFHNDISHTFMFQYGGSQYPGFAQYIVMNVS